MIHRDTQLRVEEFPSGQISRAYIELVTDGLGCEVLIPVLVARGVEPGPVFGLTAAVHGNELNGIRVIHDIFHHLDPSVLRGTLVGVTCVNVPGLHAQERQIHNQYDLNQMFPGVPDGHVAQVYASRMLDRIVGRFDFLVDLHTASFGRVNSLYVRADLEDEVSRLMALRQHPQIIVHSSPSDRTLRGAAMERGIPSITIEVGDPQLFQPRYIKATRKGIGDVLADAGMLPQRVREEEPDPIFCSSSEWIYTDMGGLLEVMPKLVARVSAGEPVGRLRNAFGDVIRQYAAPYDAVVVGKSVNPVAPTGARIIHLGRETLNRPG